MRYALINKTGNVVNVIELATNSTWTPPDEYNVVQDDACQIGDTHDGIAFTRINMMPEPIGETPRQPTKLDELEARIIALEKR